MSKSVLIVDDEPGINAALTARLQAAGYDVSNAENGCSGLEAAAKIRPDVIILDIQMPDIDGMEVRRRLKADDELAHIPIIFLSANIPMIAREQGIELDGSFYLAKPYESAEVLRAVELLTSVNAA